MMPKARAHWRSWDASGVIGDIVLLGWFSTQTCVRDLGAFKRLLGNIFDTFYICILNSNQETLEFVFSGQMVDTRDLILGCREAPARERADVSSETNVCNVSS